MQYADGWHSQYMKEIVKLSPIERFAHWVNERDQIRYYKEQECPRPWTDDVILQTYRFCNVVRFDDKVTQWLWLNWYKPNRGSPNMVLNVAIARFLNRIETLDHLGYQKSWNANLITNKLRKYRDAGNTIFNGAYMVRGNNGEDKIDSVVNYYCEDLRKQNRECSVVVSNSMQETWKAIKGCFGFGSFMAGQVTADLRWAVDGSWKDKEIWAPIGPGSQRGMNRIHERPIRTPIRQERFVEELMALKHDARKLINRPLYARMEAMDWQNCLCEFDKYTRTLLDGRRPKQIYRESNA